MAEVYQWPKGWGDEPILTIEKGEVFAGRKREGFFSSDEPITTVDGDKVYEGERNVGFFSSDDPIAIVVDGGWMSAAAAAVYLQLM